MNREVENAKQCIKNSCEGLALETIEKYYNKEINRLNNIIDELEKELDLNLQFKVIGVKRLKNKLKELKGDNK